MLIEDEAMLSLQLEDVLTQHGGQVLGPVGSVSDAIALIQNQEKIDLAVLDIDLRGETVFPAASLLETLDVPYVFHTGLTDRPELEKEFSHIPVCAKPFEEEKLLGALSDLIKEN